MQAYVDDLDASQKDGHFQNYADYSRTLRAWLVAYGIGGPVLFLTNDNVAPKVAASGDAREIILAFLLGVGLQIILALINKWGAWHLYVGAGDQKYQTRIRYGFWGFVNKQSWLDLVLDVASIAAFAWATWRVFNVFLTPVPASSMSSEQMTNSDLIAASAGMIALCALFISIWQSYLMRKHNRLSAKPFLEVDIDTTVQRGVGLHLRNTGLGPAILQSLKADRAGKTYDLMKSKALDEFLSSIVPEELPGIGFKTRILSPGAAIGAGEEIFVFELDGKHRSQELMIFARQQLENARVVVEFKCIYADAYVTGAQ